MIEFENRLSKRWRHLKKWARRTHAEAFRVYDRDIPGFPFFVDCYGDAAVVQIWARSSETEEKERISEDEVVAVVARVMEISPQHVFLKTRQRQKGASQYERLARQSVERCVKEGDLQFIVNLSDYVDTGLFLDHRPTRRIVRDMAADLRILNTFAYTGSFSVAALAGGAKQVTTLDMSNTYLNWTLRNLQLNQLDEARHRFVREDAMVWLGKQKQSADYDLIILDPPSFSNSKRMRESFDIQRDHAELIRRTLRLLRPGGKLLFSANRRRFRLDPMLAEIANITDITKQTTPEDFKRRPPHVAWWIEIA